MYIKFNHYKNKFLAISLIAIFAISIAMTFAPTASAQIPFKNPRTTAGYISVAPLLIGVGQQATVNLWVCPLPGDYALTTYFNPATNGGSYSGISVTFTRPDGTKDTFSPTDAIGIYPSGVVDALGSMYFYYTPNMAGNWSLTMSMPAQNFTDQTGTVQWIACTSAPAYFTVTTEQQNAGILNGWPWSPLPNENVYWTTPINANNREWAAITGDWLQQDISSAPMFLNIGQKWQAYGSGPSTGHILWDIPWTSGGIQGGALGDISTMIGTPYGACPIIMNGKVYLGIIPSSYNAAAKQFECIDLTTGKILWTATGNVKGGIHVPGNAYIQSAVSGNNPTGGTVALESSYGKTPSMYIFDSTGGWKYYDANTGALMVSITNVTASTFEFVDGSELAWGCTTAQMNATTFMYAQNYVWEWNMTKVVNNDWYTGLVWKTAVNNPARGIPGPGDGSGRFGFAMSADASTLVYGGGAGGNLVEGFNAQTGKSIWNLTLPYTSEIGMMQLSGTNNFIEYDITFSTWECYSDLTGALVWSTPNVGTYPWNTKCSGTAQTNDNNNLYIAEPNGQIVALSLATGKQVWASAALPSTEYITNVVGSPSNSALILVGGNVYVYWGYMTVYQPDPLTRFSVMLCINATTGATTFTLNGGIMPTAASNGYIVGAGTLDGNYYCVGKGQSSTSVSIQNDVIAEGSTALIKGNVLDQSPAQPGTPAVSDSSISEQMDYLHMQNATLLNNPPQEQGVPVTLTVLDPNMNTVTIGTTTTNSAGNFGFNFVPKTTGIYTVTASFAGTNSYWPSTSQTMLTVVAASSSTTSAPTTTTSTDVTTPILMAAIAIIIVIIISVAVAILVLRKRP